MQTPELEPATLPRNVVVRIAGAGGLLAFETLAATRNGAGKVALVQLNRSDVLRARGEQFASLDRGEAYLLALRDMELPRALIDNWFSLENVHQRLGYVAEEAPAAPAQDTPDQPAPGPIPLGR